MKAHAKIYSELRETQSILATSDTKILNILLHSIIRLEKWHSCFFNVKKYKENSILNKTQFTAVVSLQQARPTSSRL